MSDSLYNMMRYSTINYEIYFTYMCHIYVCVYLYTYIHAHTYISIYVVKYVK